MYVVWVVWMSSVDREYFCKKLKREGGRGSVWLVTTIALTYSLTQIKDKIRKHPIINYILTSSFSLHCPYIRRDLPIHGSWSDVKKIPCFAFVIEC